jgi:hypothetical protein
MRARCEHRASREEGSKAEDPRERSTDSADRSTRCQHLGHSGHRRTDSESRRAADVLTDMQQRRDPLALVVEELGAISGLVTLEDLIEETGWEKFSPSTRLPWNAFGPSRSVLVLHLALSSP